MATEPMTGKRITVFLTRRQYDALAMAVACIESEWEQDGEPAPNTQAALGLAFDKIRTAWRSA